MYEMKFRYCLIGSFLFNIVALSTESPFIELHLLRGLFKMFLCNDELVSLTALFVLHLKNLHLTVIFSVTHSLL